MTITCDWCGQQVPADPRCFVESGFSGFAENEPDAADDWKGGTPMEKVSIDPSEVSKEQRDHMKREMGLDDDQLDQILTTGHVENGAAIVCLKCQDEGIEVEDQP